MSEGPGRADLDAFGTCGDEGLTMKENTAQAFDFEPQTSAFALRLTRCRSRRRRRLRLEWLEDRTLLSTFSVVSTGDGGPGTLRQAILDSNAAAGQVNTIDFALTGQGVQTIEPVSPLPAITAAVLIDGWSQPGYAGTPLIELNGSQTGTADGLVITAPNVTVRGMDIANFASGAGIHITGAAATNDWIYGDFLGTDPTGTSAEPDYEGVKIDGGAKGNLVGTSGDGVDDAAERNIISGDVFAGVWISGQRTSNNAVAGNFIGTDVTGTISVPNDTEWVSSDNAEFSLGGGVYIDGGASDNRIGTDGASVDDAGERNVVEGIQLNGNGTDGNIIAGNFIGTDVTGTRSLTLFGSDGVFLGEGPSYNWIGVNPNGGADVGAEGNVISGNYDGIQIWLRSNDNVIAGNEIGTNATGSIAVPNQEAGIDIEQGCDGNTIGGATAGAGNLITNNGGPGVDMTDTCTGNQITANRIFGNTGQAIDLGNDGVTDNAPSPRQGPNKLQNFPIIVGTSSGQLEGWLGGSVADTSYAIEFFASSTYNADGSGEAEDFLGSMEVTTDASGQAIFTVPFTAPAGLPVITATATDPLGDTSEVSALRAATLATPPQSLRATPNQSLIFSTTSSDGIAIQDPDAGPLNPAWNLTLSVAAGTLTLSSTAGLTGSGDGTGSLSYSGPLSAVDAALDGVTYVPPPGPSPSSAHAGRARCPVLLARLFAWRVTS